MKAEKQDADKVILEKGRGLAMSLMHDAVKESKNEFEMHVCVSILEQTAISILATMMYNHQRQGGVLNGEYLSGLNKSIMDEVRFIESDAVEIRMTRPGGGK